MTGIQSFRPVRGCFVAEHVSGVTILQFTEAELLDEEAVREFRRQMEHLLGDVGRRRFVLDFGRVRRLSSTMLGALVAFQKKVKQAGGDLALCSLGPEPYEQLERTRLHFFFRICPGETEARQAISGTPSSGSVGAR